MPKLLKINLKEGVHLYKNELKKMKNSTLQHRDLYQEITDKVVEQLEQGFIPWQKPWKTCGSTECLSHTTGKPYTFLNQMLLGMSGQPSGEFLTFNQAIKEGGKVRKGERGSMVVFWCTGYTKKEVNDKGEEITVYKEYSVPILKHYYVFEVGQCDGIKRKYNQEQQPKSDVLQPVERAEEIVQNYFGRESVRLNIQKCDNAYYSPSQDIVVVPQLSQFSKVAEYYSTLFHEMTHSTGADCRLKRGFSSSQRFGDTSYSKEELVAEMGAAYLINHSGIDCAEAFKNSVAYIQSWLGELRNDKKLLITAAGKAEAATRFILGEV